MIKCSENKHINANKSILILIFLEQTKLIKYYFKFIFNDEYTF